MAALGAAISFWVTSWQLATMSAPLHTPYRNAAADFQIGLRPTAAQAWLDVTSGYADYLPLKRARLRHDEARYYRALPRSLPAQEELLNAAVAHLCADHAKAFARVGAELNCKIDGITHALDQVDVEPLRLLSDVIEEDLIILEAVDGQMIITAASNPYTSSGRIIASVGGAMTFAHAPVPQLNDQMGARVERILSNLKAGVLAERFNWLLTAIGTLLFPPDSHAANAEASARTAQILMDDDTLCGELLYIRTERQTLLKLPDSGAVAFAIHTYSDPLSAIAKDRESLAGMRDALASYSAARLGYSAMTDIRAPVLRWIDRRLDAS